MFNKSNDEQLHKEVFGGDDGGEGSGDDGGNWVIELTDDTRDVRQGEDENAQCVINMSCSDFMAMIDGSLNPQMAFMTGRLRVKGDMGLALKLQTILN